MKLSSEQLILLQKYDNATVRVREIVVDLLDRSPSIQNDVVDKRRNNIPLTGSQLNCLSYCVDKLMFISDGLEANDISVKGYSGASILIQDVADELDAIQGGSKNRMI